MKKQLIGKQSTKLSQINRMIYRHIVDSCGYFTFTQPRTIDKIIEIIQQRYVRIISPRIYKEHNLHRNNPNYRPNRNTRSIIKPSKITEDMLLTALKEMEIKKLIQTVVYGNGITIKLLQDYNPISTGKFEYVK